MSIGWVGVAFVAAASLAACGDDEGATTASASTTTTSSSTQPSSTTATATAETTTTEPGAERPSGAVSPIAAAAAVLTSDGTPLQACDRFVTESFIDTAYGGKANCLASRRGKALARSILVGSLDADSQPAHLVVIPKGGPYDGARVEVELVRTGDLFRVDSLEAHVPAGP